MNVEIASALYRYFEALYELNQNIMVLCGIDVLDNRGAVSYTHLTLPTIA